MKDVTKKMKRKEKIRRRRAVWYNDQQKKKQIRGGHGKENVIFTREHKIFISFFVDQL
jgi:hypothetical protein